jgi:hypothetical protein
MDDRNWWERNWKWFVPVGCLVVVLIGAALVVGLVVFVFGMFKHNGAYVDAVHAAEANPVVAAELGSPVEEGFMASGNINENGASGHADMAIPLTGPRGKAMVYVVADKSAGRWKFATLVAEIERTHQRIDLLAPTEATVAPPRP